MRYLFFMPLNTVARMAITDAPFLLSTKKRLGERSSSFASPTLAETVLIT